MRLGILYMLAASLLFSTMAALVKLLRGFPTQEIVLVRSLLNVAFTLALMRRYRVPLLGTNRRALFLRGILGYAALSFHFYALGRMPLADAVVIHNVSPAIIAALAPFVLGERAGGARAFAVSLAGLAGVALLVRPTGDLGLAPSLAALAGAAFSAGAYLTIRSIGTREHPLTVVLYFPLISVLLSAAPAARAWHAPGAVEWLLLLGVGVTTTAAQICLTAALQRERAAAASTASYASLVFSALLGLLFFAEVPDARTLAGAAIVIGAVWAASRAPGPPATGARP